MFSPRNAHFETAVRESFERLALMRTLGASLDRVSPGEVEVGLPFRADLTQHHGFMAAAVLTAVVDVACGYAAMTLMPAGSSVLTVEYKANFLAPARGDRIVARARVVRPGRTVTVCAGDVIAVDGARETLVATLLGTMIRVAGERAPDSAVSTTPARTRAAVHPRGLRRWCLCRAWRARRSGITPMDPVVSQES